MAYDLMAASRVRQCLASRNDVEEKKMMGGLVFMVGGHMCVGVNADQVMARVGEAGHADAVQQPHARQMVFGRMRPAGYIFVAPEGYASDAALAAWIRRGVDFVATLPAKSARPGARPTRSKRAYPLRK